MQKKQQLEYLIQANKVERGVQRTEELSQGREYSLGSLTAVITRRKPFALVPQESVMYFSVTKFVRV